MTFLPERAVCRHRRRQQKTAFFVSGCRQGALAVGDSGRTQNTNTRYAEWLGCNSRIIRGAGFTDKPGDLETSMSVRERGAIPLFTLTG